ncbi:ADAMTS-like protein 2 [Triplophysa tibetana]|uniref:ADAMTS-like protein 2 n=1 Tax=Triplophysa tibetana TaxID=1572043 RepID=A0A5A9PBP9_9TELE|nr:ADAMTS-like protein 2 [Triplophysa tibetana]
MVRRFGEIPLEIRVRAEPVQLAPISTSQYGGGSERLTSTQNINSSFCIGSSKKYQLCTNQPCPNSRISFKQHQCSQFNAKAFGRKHYEWVPLYPDDYISISNKPCDLQCTTTTVERQLLVPAHDGTFCRDGIYQGVCIEGQCQVVGCDGKLYSSKTIDKCGVCGGNGGSCYRVSGSYRKGITQLALSDEAGHFFFNGNSVIDNPQNFHVAGTVFKYRRPANLFSDGFEYIMAQGPTQHALNVMYYNLNGKMPHITYEYTVPRSPEPRTAPPMPSTPEQPQISNLMSMTSKDTSLAEKKVNTSSIELSFTHNEIEGREEYGKKGNQSASLAPQENVELRVGAEELLWELQASVNLSGLVLFRPAGEVLQNELDDEMHHLETQGSFGSDSNLIDGDSSSSSDSNHTTTSVLKSLIYDGMAWPPGSRQPCKDDLALPDCSILRLNSSSSLDNSLTLEIYPGSLDMHTSDGELVFGSHSEPRTNDSTNRSNLLQLHQVEPVQAPHSESNEFEVESLDRDISVADKYRWKVSAYAPCSSTCTTGATTNTIYCIRKSKITHYTQASLTLCSVSAGISSSYALCVKYDGSEVDESHCDSLTRPEPTHEFCTGKECPPRSGTATFTVIGVTALELQKPMTRKACKSKSCGPQWEISDWSECSGLCGEGRMRRYVVCKNSNGKVISDGQCDPELKPLAVHPCGDKNCPAHWVEQEWEQCNATCGRGVKRRQVVCAGLEAGVFKEFPERICDRSRRPSDSATCFERPCSKWFTTSWSQCSKTCGIGVRVREVKCYQGEELGHSCDSTLRPEARQSCEVLPCTTEAPGRPAVCPVKTRARKSFTYWLTH